MKKSSSGNYTIYESTDPCELHKYSETLSKELEKKDNEIEKSLKESADNINELEEENILNEENITEIIDLLPKVSNEGESIALENTARAKFTKFRIEGNSKQETREGYNLCNVTDQTITTVDAANTWLATQKEKGTPVVIEYKLAEEVVEPYTEVQKEAYEQIKNAISYKGQTNIFSTNEIKPIFEVEALADIGLLLNNMQAQILAGGE